METRIIILLSLLALALAVPQVEVDVSLEGSRGADEAIVKVSEDFSDVSKPKPKPKPGPAPALPACNGTTALECMAESGCCEWCATPFNLTAGWCMSATKTPIPFLTCKAAPNKCHKAKTEAKCSEEFDCLWTPTPKLGKGGKEKGTCDFNPVACRKPKAEEEAPKAQETVSVNLQSLSKESNSFAMQAQVAIQQLFAPTEQTKPAPKPKPSACNATTATECLKDECCEWCATPFNMTKGWCMSNTIPIPFLTCKAAKNSCPSYKSAAKCEADPHCSWSADLAKAKGWAGAGVPPHAGSCVFDAGTCA